MLFSKSKKTLDHNTFCWYKNSFVYYRARKNVPKISKAYIIYSLDRKCTSQCKVRHAIYIYTRPTFRYKPGFYEKKGGDIKKALLFKYVREKWVCVCVCVCVCGGGGGVGEALMTTRDYCNLIFHENNWDQIIHAWLRKEKTLNTLRSPIVYCFSW